MKPQMPQPPPSGFDFASRFPNASKSAVKLNGSITDNRKPPAIISSPMRAKPTKNRIRQNSAGLSSAVLMAWGIYAPHREFRFDKERRWRFDYAWIVHSVALEVEGGVWTGGRHTTGTGFLKDMEKYNRAVILGWRIVRCTPSKLESSETMLMLKELLK